MGVITNYDQQIEGLGISFKPFIKKVGKVVRSFTTTAGKIIKAPVKIVVKTVKGIAKNAVIVFGVFRLNKILKKVVSNPTIKGRLKDEVKRERSRKGRKLTDDEVHVVVKNKVDTDPVIKSEIRKEITGEGISDLGEPFTIILGLLSTVAVPLIIAWMNNKAASATIDQYGDLNIAEMDNPSGVIPEEGKGFTDDKGFNDFIKGFSGGYTIPVILGFIGLIGVALIAKRKR